MRTVTDLLTDKLGADKCYKLEDLADKYRCPTALDFSIDVVGLSYCLFWIGVIAGSASSMLDLQACELCGEAMGCVSKELFKIFSFGE